MPHLVFYFERGPQAIAQPDPDLAAILLSQLPGLGLQAVSLHSDLQYLFA